MDATIPVTRTSGFLLVSLICASVLAIPQHRFINENETARKNGAVRDLIPAIFGKDAVAEDSIL
jgi:hypothetical protein